MPEQSVRNAPTPSNQVVAPAPVTRGTLVWFGLGFVALSFFAAFLGSWLARSVDTVEPPPPASSEPPVEADPGTGGYQDALDDILPAGSVMRAGSGAPESGKGYEGDVYINIQSADVYLFQDDWTRVGNVRESAARNLTGATGETGAQGPQGEQGEPGVSGTQVSLGLGAPDDATCIVDGDIFVDASTVQFFECEGGAWALFGPPSDPAPEPGE